MNLTILFVGLLIGWALGAAYPHCVPGQQQGCNTPSGALGVQYCNRNGFGWEVCQRLDSPVYPQALWRQ